MTGTFFIRTADLGITVAASTRSGRAARSGRRVTVEPVPAVVGTKASSLLPDEETPPATVVTSEDRCLLGVVFDLDGGPPRLKVIRAAVTCAKVVEELAEAVGADVLDCGGPIVYVTGSAPSPPERAELEAAGVGCLEPAPGGGSRPSPSDWARRLEASYLSGLKPSRWSPPGPLPPPDTRFNRMPDGVEEKDVRLMVDYLSRHGEPL